MTEQSKSIAAIRRDYSATVFDTVPDSPFVLFQEWFDAVCAEKSIDDPTAFVLASVDENAIPDSRVVLLKTISEGRFIFYTNYLSAKGLQLEKNTHVAMNFYWPHFSRQIRIRGVAEKTSYATSSRYFASRPHASQVAAVVSKQSQAINREEFSQAYQSALSDINGADIPCPEHWGGYAITPHEFEFWLGQKDRLHQRLHYNKQDESWHLCFLAP